MHRSGAPMARVAISAPGPFQVPANYAQLAGTAADCRYGHEMRPRRGPPGRGYVLPTPLLHGPATPLATLQGTR